MNASQKARLAQLEATLSIVADCQRKCRVSVAASKSHHNARAADRRIVGIIRKLIER